MTMLKHHAEAMAAHHLYQIITLENMILDGKSSNIDVLARIIGERRRLFTFWAIQADYLKD